MRLVDADKLIEDYTQTFVVGHGIACAEMFQGVVNQSPIVEAIPKSQYEQRLKADMVAMLKDLQSEIEEVEIFKNVIGWELTPKTPTNIKQDCIAIIQQKINELKADPEGGK